MYYGEAVRIVSNLLSRESTYLVSEKLSPASNAELDSLETWLEAPLPRGYRAFMATFGAGNYCGFINLLSPDDIRRSCEQRRAILRQYYAEFWSKSVPELPVDQAVQGVLFACTDDGDEVYYYPQQGRSLFAMPRHDEVIYRLPSGFDDPLDWHSPVREQTYVFQPPFRYFFPESNEYRSVELFTRGSFNIHDICRLIEQRWAGQETRSIWGDFHVHLFLRALQGRIQLSQSEGDSRVGIQIQYDRHCSEKTESLVADLTAMGFYETGRYPPPTS